MTRPIPTDAHNFACRINFLSREIQAAVARLLDEHGVTPAQASLLYHLARGETSPSRIAEELAIDASNLSRLIRTLGDRGVLTREVDDDNRTRVAIRLTPAGRALAKAIDPHADVIARSIEGALSPGQLRAFSRALTAVTRAVQDV